MKDPLLYNSREHNVEVYLSDIDTLFKIGGKKRLLFVNTEKAKKINDIEECVILFDKSIYNPERNMITIRMTLTPNIELSESFWEISVDAKNFCKDIVKSLIADEPSEEFLYSHYGTEFIGRIIKKIEKTALKSNYIILEEDIAGLGFVKYDGNCINTFELCNFSLNRIDIHQCSRSIEYSNEAVKIEINVNGYLMSIENCIVHSNNQEHGNMQFLLNSGSSFSFLKNNINYISFEDFQSQDEWRKDRLKYLSAYENNSNVKISNKMFSF